MKISNNFSSGIARSSTIFLIIAICLALLIIPSILMERSLRKEIQVLKNKIKEMTVLNKEYTNLRDSIYVLENRMSLTKVAGTAQALDDIFSSLGMKGKMKSVKSFGTREIKNSMKEERAEVLIERINMNELINMLFKIKDAPMLLSIKKINMKKSFENPELIDVTMTVALFARK
jgi:hypothetical protein